MASKRPAEEDKKVVYKKPRGMRALFQEEEYTDVSLVTGDKTIKAHRSVLVVVPFFESLFRIGPSMREGSTPDCLTVRLERSYDSVLALVRYVYQFPNGEAFPDTIDKLLTLYTDLDFFQYPPVLEEIWTVVGEIRGRAGKPQPTPEERRKALEFASTHKLKLGLWESDIAPEVIKNLSYETLVYVCEAQGDGWGLRSINTTKTRMIMEWLLYVYSSDIHDLDMAEKLATFIDDDKMEKDCRIKLVSLMKRWAVDNKIPGLVLALNIVKPNIKKG